MPKRSSKPRDLNLTVVDALLRDRVAIVHTLYGHRKARATTAATAHRFALALRVAGNGQSRSGEDLKTYFERQT